MESFAARLGLETSVELRADSTPLLDDMEPLAATFSAVDLVLGDAQESQGQGTVYVTSRRVLWVADGAAPLASLGMAFPQIIMHAVSRDAEAFAKPCIYLQLDEGSEDGGFGNEEDEGEDEEPPAAEVRLVPVDELQVEALFKQLCEGSALNPDPDVEEEGQAELFFDDDEVLAGLSDEQRAEVLAARTQGLEVDEGEDDIDELMGDDPERFEDEDEAEAATERGPRAAPPPTSNGVA